MRCGHTIHQGCLHKLQDHGQNKWAACRPASARLLASAARCLPPAGRPPWQLLDAAAALFLPLRGGCTAALGRSSAPPGRLAAPSLSTSPPLSCPPPARSAPTSSPPPHPPTHPSTHHHQHPHTHTHPTPGAPCAPAPSTSRTSCASSGTRMTTPWPPRPCRQSTLTSRCAIAACAWAACRAAPAAAAGAAHPPRRPGRPHSSSHQQGRSGPRAAAALPPQQQVNVLCNDCTPSVRSSAPFHVVGHKCDVCGGYNTQRV
jgi:hypothetical protein